MSCLRGRPPRHPENTHHPQGWADLDMGLVIEFPARLAHVARMANDLTAAGRFTRRVCIVAMWRRRARAPPDRSGRPVRTMAHGDEAWAILTDWPRDADEQRVNDEAVRAAMAAMTIGPLG